jgi:hypothetical protein
MQVKCPFDHKIFSANDERTKRVGSRSFLIEYRVGSHGFLVRQEHRSTMKTRRVITRVVAPSYLLALAFGCSQADEDGGTAGTAGTVSTSGASSTAGVSSTGGTVAAAGTSSTGGTSSTAGTPSTGGMSGSAPTGGAVTAGNSSGGTMPQGGNGGTSAGGGASAGTTSSGGSGGSDACGTATAKPCPPTGNNSIAYIGCSMANNIGNGYKAVNGKIMWNSDGYGTGAQCVPQWVEGGSAWGGFDNKLKAIGGKDVVKAIMVQICIINPATDDQVKSMIKAARAHVNPDAHIYLVGQPQYENGHHCDIAGGKEGTTDEQAKRLGEDKSIDPNMSYLGVFLLNCDKGECADSCHASSGPGKGEERLGNQAKAFWGG